MWGTNLAMDFTKYLPFSTSPATIPLFHIATAMYGKSFRAKGL